MSRDEIRAAVIDALSRIAPEAELGALDGSKDLREQVELDSFDFLNVIVALHERTGVDVPERDYPRLTTLDRIVDYLAARLERPAAGA